MSLQAAGAVRPAAPIIAMSPRHPLARAGGFASPFSTKRLIILANSGDSGIILEIQGGPSVAPGRYRPGVSAGFAYRKRPPPGSREAAADRRGKASKGSRLPF